MLIINILRHSKKRTYFHFFTGVTYFFSGLLFRNETPLAKKTGDLSSLVTSSSQVRISNGMNRQINESVVKKSDKRELQPTSVQGEIKFKGAAQFNETPIHSHSDLLRLSKDVTKSHQETKPINNNNFKNSSYFNLYGSDTVHSTISKSFSSDNNAPFSSENEIWRNKSCDHAAPDEKSPRNVLSLQPVKTRWCNSSTLIQDNGIFGDYSHLKVQKSPKQV